IISLLTFYFSGTAQVAINPSNNPADNSAMLDVSATDRGVLIPRMTQAQRIAIANPATSLLVYQTDGASGYYYNSGSPSSPNWVALFTSATAGWSVTGNAGTNPNTHFIGTTDSADFVFKTNNTEKFRIAANGNVGIGTANPASALYIWKDFNGPMVMFEQDNIFNSAFVVAGPASFSDTVSVVDFWLNNGSTPGLHLKQNGYIGIGKYNPSVPLEVQKPYPGSSGTFEVAKFTVLDATGTTDRGLRIFGTSSGSAVGIGKTTSADFQFYDHETNPLITVKDNGNVGIGTSTPGAKLDVNGDIKTNELKMAQFIRKTIGVVSVSSETIVATLTIPNYSPFSAEITAHCVDGLYPEFSSVQKIYITCFQEGSGALLNIVVENKSLSGTDASWPTWTWVNSGDNHTFYLKAIDPSGSMDVRLDVTFYNDGGIMFN
ncbi:MAG: hypothetical protein HY840_09415, partial [Bacteroidetes bacterium]|nr:hypothetical protein [Bacteroidota bacterium]